MKLSKDVFNQYGDIVREIESLKRREGQLEDSIAKLVEEGTVTDKVYGGNGGAQGFVIEGFPIKEYERRRKILRNSRDRIIRRENDLLELKEKIETEIDNIESSRDRQVFYEYFIAERTQEEVADMVCVERSAISKIIKKYFEF